MTPETKKSVEMYLDHIVRDFNALARRVGTIAAEGSTLSVSGLNDLATANAAAEAAISIQSAMAGTEDEAYLTRLLQRRMSYALDKQDCHPASIKVYNAVLTLLRNDTGAA